MTGVWLEESEHVLADERARMGVEITTIDSPPLKMFM